MSTVINFDSFTKCFFLEIFLRLFLANWLWYKPWAMWKWRQCEHNNEIPISIVCGAQFFMAFASTIAAAVNCRVIWDLRRKKSLSVSFERAVALRILQRNDSSSLNKSFFETMHKLTHKSLSFNLCFRLVFCREWVELLNREWKRGGNDWVIFAEIYWSY